MNKLKTSQAFKKISNMPMPKGPKTMPAGPSVKIPMPSLPKTQVANNFKGALSSIKNPEKRVNKSQFTPPVKEVQQKKEIIKKQIAKVGDGKGGIGSSLKSLARKVKEKAVDITSDVLSAPARAYYGVKANRANADADVIKKARDYDNAPDWTNEGEVSDAQKTRFMAKLAKERLTKKNK